MQTVQPQIVHKGKYVYYVISFFMKIINSYKVSEIACGLDKNCYKRVFLGTNTWCKYFRVMIAYSLLLLS